MSRYPSTAPAPGSTQCSPAESVRAAVRPGAIIVLLILAASIVVLSACSGSSGRLAEIHFAIDGGGEADAAAAVVIRNVQFYVHDVQLLDAAGRSHPFRLEASAPWQSERVALVDLTEDGASVRNGTLRGTLAAGAGEAYKGIRFSIGVPFDLNHANVLTAAAPLDRAELFWTWQSGHKFLRVDLLDKEKEKEWSFHLGSTGCSSASAMRPPTAACAQPNVMHVEISGIDPLRQSIRLQLNELVSSMRAVEHAICTGDYAHNPACSQVWAKTGLQAATGKCPNDQCSGQQLWSAE